MFQFMKSLVFWVPGTSPPFPSHIPSQAPSRSSRSTSSQFRSRSVASKRPPFLDSGDERSSYNESLLEGGSQASDSDECEPQNKRPKVQAAQSHLFDSALVSVEQPVHKQLVMNSAQFQGLLFSGDCELALQWAQKCNLVLDSSRLYGVDRQNSGGTVFEAWAKISGKVATIEGLFNVLLKTNAHKAPELVGKDMYLAAFSGDLIQIANLECLLSRPDLFPIDTEGLCALNLASRLSSSSDPDWVTRIILGLVRLTAKHQDCYDLFNKMGVFNGEMSNPLRSMINRSNSEALGALLTYIPFVDLDIFTLANTECERCKQQGSCSEHRWFSAEEWWELKKDEAPVAGWQIRAARGDLEEYRWQRDQRVHQMWAENMLPLMPSVCDIICAFGARPTNSDIATLAENDDDL